MKSRHSFRLRWPKACAVVSALALTIGLGAISAPAVQAAPQPTPIASYDFSTAPADNATVLNSAGSDFSPAVVQNPNADLWADEALTLTGGSKDSTGSWVRLPDDLLKGQKSATVQMDVKADASMINGFHFLWNIGNEKPETEYFFATVNCSNNRAPLLGMKSAGVEKLVQSGSCGVKANEWMSVAAVIDGETTPATASLFINGEQVATEDVSATPENILDQSFNTIGRAPWPDPLFKGAVSKFSVYDTALSASELEASYADQALEWAKKSLAPRIPQKADANFVLPSSASGVAVQWEVVRGTAITIVDGIAQVTQPTAEAGAQDVTLRASFVVDGETLDTQEFVVQVPADLADTERAQADLAAIVIENANDMRMNFSVPASGDQGSTISWEIAAGQDFAAIVEGVNDQTKTVNINRPAAGAAAATGTLKATVTNGAATLTKSFDIKIQPMPSTQGELEAYFWAFFTGEGDGAEHVSVAASKGNDALAWNTLNSGVPIIESTEGTEGLRDPFIIRSQDGDKFYMIATDLRIAGLPGGFTTAQISGSKYLEIWESTDLINWGEQRHVKVSADSAGNTWAPEAFYDDETEQYVVYWASNLYDTDNAADRTDVTYNRMMYVTTQDFISFSKPEIWIDVAQGKGKGVIDVSVAKEGDTYYRFYKNESNMTLLEEKSNTFLTKYSGTTMPDTHDNPDQWSLITKEIAAGLPNGVGDNKFRQGEGPTVFKSNAGDVNGNQWYLMIDQPDYHGGPNHYVPFATKKSLAETEKNDWHSEAAKLSQNLPQNKDGGKPRHGTIIPVTRAEYQATLEAYQPNIAVKSVAALSVETAEGQAPDLPETADLTMFEGDNTTAEIVWDVVDAVDYAQAGQFTVHGVAQDDSRMPVEVTVTVSEEPVAPAIDKSVLAAAVLAADGLVAEDYTAESWSDVAAAVAAGQAVLADEDATQDEVDAAVAVLAAAVADLAKVPGPVDPTDPTDPNKPGASPDTDDDLAQTGANVMGLLLGLMAAGLGGLGLLLAARRRA